YIIKPFVAKTLGAKILSVLQSRTNPPEHVKLIKAGEALIKQGQFDLALDVFKESGKLRDSARVQVNIGGAYEKMGKNDKASGSYQSAAEKNPMFLRAHVASANLHIKTGNEDAALKSLENAIKISPRNTDRQISAGKIYLGNGDDKKAQAAFEEAVKLEPAKGEEVAEELLKEGRAELAEVFFRNSLAADKGNVHIYNRLGIALRKQGKWFDAVEEYKKALKIDPKDEVICFNMGKAYIEGGKNDEAIDSFKKALKINPNFKEAKDELEKL
ncbi:MAG: tetratricopeptide repeat protein, partial [Nitrospinota bacterium]